MSYRSHMRALVYRLALLYVDVLLGPSIVKIEINFVHIVAIE